MWSKGDMILFPRKDSLSLATNDGRITLTCISAKLYNKMISNRAGPFIDPLLRPNQNGFRKGHSTLSQILTIWRVIKSIKEKNL